MGLNDEREKLRQAEEWLTTKPRDSDAYGAAWDHLRWVLANTTDSSLRDYAGAIADRIITRAFPAYPELGRIGPDRGSEDDGIACDCI